MSLIRLALASIVLTIVIGCSGKDTSHDVKPPEGTHSLGVPKFIQEKHKQAQGQ